MKKISERKQRDTEQINVCPCAHHCLTTRISLTFWHYPRGWAYWLLHHPGNSHSDAGQHSQSNSQRWRCQWYQGDGGLSHRAKSSSQHHNSFHHTPTCGPPRQNKSNLQGTLHDCTPTVFIAAPSFTYECVKKRWAQQSRLYKEEMARQKCFIKRVNPVLTP